MVLFTCLLALPALLCTLLKKRFEHMAAPIVCVLMLVTYVLAMFRALDWFVWIACVSVLCAGVFLILQFVKGQGKALFRSFYQNFLTPGLLCFVILAVLYFAGSQPHIVSATDDIYYWGVQVRSIFGHGGLVDATRHLSRAL